MRQEQGRVRQKQMCKQTMVKTENEWRIKPTSNKRAKNERMSQGIS